jgi:hypothetical protein
MRFQRSKLTQSEPDRFDTGTRRPKHYTTQIVSNQSRDPQALSADDRRRRVSDNKCCAKERSADVVFEVTAGRDSGIFPLSGVSVEDGGGVLSFTSSFGGGNDSSPISPRLKRRTSSRSGMREGKLRREASPRRASEWTSSRRKRPARGEAVKCGLRMWAARSQASQ